MVTSTMKLTIHILASIVSGIASAVFSGALFLFSLGRLLVGGGPGGGLLPLFATGLVGLVFGIIGFVSCLKWLRKPSSVD